MTRRDRLMATLRGEPVDRPAVNFYEISAGRRNADDPDEFNVYSDPSWQPLIHLAEEQTDLIRMRGPLLKPAPDNCRDDFFCDETCVEDGSRFTRTIVTVGGKALTSLSRRDRDVDTVWRTEHLLKDVNDVKAYLELPDGVHHYEPDMTDLLDEEERIGDRGVVMIDSSDPICVAAELFSMADFMIMALTEQTLFHRLLEKVADSLHARTRQIAKAVPGRLWRICGPEYATEPYLPPHLFEEYVVRYTQPMVESIQAEGGFVRLHCHGRIRSALPHMAAMHVDGIDPIEPPPQGDVELADVRREYGRDMVLFGNLEVSQIEVMEPHDFEEVVAGSLRDGTAGQGRGFVLMPSASPYGRTITPRTLANYETMVRLAVGFKG